MFGYVIPVKCELKMREFEQFRAAYCGLCHSLKERYGFIARFVLNYDFTFLAILLSAGNETVSYCKKRCIASPIRPKRCIFGGGEPFSQAAGYSLILSWWKLQDGIADSGPIKGLKYKFPALLLYSAYRRAQADFPDFDTHCRSQLEILRKLEEEGSGELDRVADAFAAILPFAVKGEKDPDRRRVLELMLYQTGRWIYLIDAYDDLEGDKKVGAYNPLIRRFDPGEGLLDEADADWMKTTLAHSGNLITSAYHLLPEGPWSGILENIIYLGFPAVTKAVLERRFRRGTRGLLKAFTSIRERKEHTAI